MFSVFKKILNIIFLDFVLILALFSIYYLAENYFWLLLWVIILVICSDVGGYVFGKIFKWKKLTNISPKKTVSGLLGSFISINYFLVSDLYIFKSLLNTFKLFLFHKLLSIDETDVIPFPDPTTKISS